ncbi:PEP-CTERM motif protein [Opitutaceae bacterium TAV5]|nr:PEP-CTERM motif protein [Opitutaceae bacterium TAV5]
MKTTTTRQSVRSPRSATTGLALVLAVLALPASAPLARAKWTGTVDNDYTNPANWRDGVIDGIFSSSLGANTEVLFPSGSYAIDRLSISHADNYYLRILPPAGSSTAGTTLSLGDVSVDIAGDSASQEVAIGVSSRPLTIDFGSTGTRTITVNPSLVTSSNGRDTLSLYGAVTGHNLLKTGGGSLNLYAATTLSGSYVQTGGTTFLRGYTHPSAGYQEASFSAERLVIAGTLGRFVVMNNAGLDAALPVSLNGGTLGFQSSSAIDRTLDTLSLDGSRSALAVTPTGGASGTLTINHLERSGYATLSLLATAANPAGRGNIAIKVANDASLLADLRGGGGAAGTKNISILPWATASTANSSILDNQPNGDYYTPLQGFVTYTHDGGFRALDKATEYHASLAEAASDGNVRLTASETLSGNKTVNSLYLDYDAASDLAVDLGGATLDVTSGALAANNNSGGKSFIIRNGTLNFGDATGYITSGRSDRSSAISANITGNAGVVYAPAERLTLSGVNSYAGPTVINTGLVIIDAATALPSTSDVRVDKNATLQINNNIAASAATLAGNGLVKLNNATARLDIGNVSGSAAGWTTIGAGGTVSPGDASGYFRADTLGFTGSVRFEAGSSLLIDIGAAGGAFDSITVTGDLAVEAGATLVLNFLDGYTLRDGDSFALASVSGTGLDTLQNFTVTGAGIDGFSFTWTDGLLTATAVPEPATWALVTGASLLMLAFVRRRHTR